MAFAQILTTASAVATIGVVAVSAPAFAQAQLLPAVIEGVAGGAAGAFVQDLLSASGNSGRGTNTEGATFVQTLSSTTMTSSDNGVTMVNGLTAGEGADLSKAIIQQYATSSSVSASGKGLSVLNNVKVSGAKSASTTITQTATNVTMTSSSGGVSLGNTLTLKK